MIHCPLLFEQYSLRKLQTFFHSHMESWRYSLFQWLFLSQLKWSWYRIFIIKIYQFHITMYIFGLISMVCLRYATIGEWQRFISRINIHYVKRWHREDARVFLFTMYLIFSYPSIMLWLDILRGQWIRVALPRLICIPWCDEFHEKDIA